MTGATYILRSVVRQIQLPRRWQIKELKGWFARHEIAEGTMQPFTKSLSLPQILSILTALRVTLLLSGDNYLMAFVISLCWSMVLGGLEFI